MGGKKTSYGGRTLEDVIGSLTLKGFTALSGAQYRKQQKNGQLLLLPSGRILVKHHRYITMFGSAGYREYFIESPEWTGQLECKFQGGSGSTDEKMVYIAETLKRNSEERMAVVHGGPWWIDGRGKKIIDWLKQEAKSIKHQYGKDLLVFDMDGFFSWANRTWK